MHQTELICIGCPMGCRMTVERKEDGSFLVQGNTCPRGAEYAKKELTNPRRTITSSVRVKNGQAVRVPVKTKEEVPKGKIMECMEAIHELSVEAPVEIGDVVCRNLAGTGVDLVATKAVAVLK
ncbi:MAG: DUF1667 domain-containing protein [Lachnospiraceae bacterium]